MSRSSKRQKERSLKRQFEVDWLYGKLLNGRYTKQELQEAWKQDNKTIKSERTISRWISDLKDDLKDDKTEKLEINIRGQYYIVGKSDTEKYVAHTSKLAELLTTYDDIKDKILIDDIPSENQYLENILYAIKNNLVIKFDYKKYSDPKSKDLEIKERVVRPYCVKRFENRWYVIGFCVKSGKDKVNDMRTFSLDMIVKFKKTKTERHFEPDPNFNAAEYFKDVYGITTGENGSLTDINIRVTAWLANYLRTLPLHHSQKVVGESDSFYVFQYTLRPAGDFYNALLHLGPSAVVLSPESVRDDMKKLNQKMAEKYNICKDCKDNLR